MQLSGIEKYAMKFIEETDSAWSAEQLAAAEAEIEQQKREWEEGRLAALREEEEEQRRILAEETGEELLTYPGEEARQVNTSTPRERVQTHTRSKGSVSLDLWTLDKKVRASNCSDTPSPSQSPIPYSNPNLVIRTRRASATIANIGNNLSPELNNHTPNLVNRKFIKINRAKRKAEADANGPAL